MISKIIVDNVLKELGISRSTVDKVMNIVDNIKVSTHEDKTYITINLNKISVVIEKNIEE
jgi:hypothetical protein